MDSTQDPPSPLWIYVDIWRTPPPPLVIHMVYGCSLSAMCILIMRVVSFFLSDQNLSECLKKEAKWKKKLSQKNILAGLLARPNELNNAEN